MNEVTESQRKTFIRNQLLQRSVNGFQPGRAPLNITVPILISKLKKEQELTNPDSTIWDMFNNAWRRWVESHQVLYNILLEFDNTADFDENHQCTVSPNSELDSQCFEVLLEASLNNQIDQETIRRFYEYGYFNQCEQIEDRINEARTREEIERRQRMEQLPDQVDRLRQEIEELRTQISNLEPINELEQVLAQRITEVHQSFEKQLSKLKISQNVSQLKQLSNSLKTQIGEVEKSISTQIGEVETSLKTRLDALENSQTETDSAINDYVDHTEEIFTQLKQQIQNTSQSIEERLNAMETAIAENNSMAEEHNQTDDKPNVVHKTLEIGEHYAAKLEAERKHYENEELYRSDFKYSLSRLGVTDSDVIADVIHVALKAFPVLEISDTRIIKGWELVCNNHLYYTRIIVGMGWLGLKDWFPDVLADECFGEELERKNLTLSAQKMLEMGDMIWAIQFSDCDRSLPEGYLPSFIKWINEFSNDTIKVFLTRCAGTNRCEITEDTYALTARLPEPHTQEPVESKYVRPSGYIVTQSEWGAWCSPNNDVDLPNENQLEFLEQLRSTIENKGVRVPITLLREIYHYLRLSHDILASTLALDWALTLRFLPWIENQPQIIKSVLSMQHLDDLQHFREELKKAREKTNESN